MAYTSKDICERVTYMKLDTHTPSRNIYMGIFTSYISCEIHMYMRYVQVTHIFNHRTLD